MKNIGVWLDKKKAHIIYLSNGAETFETVNSDIENFNVTSNVYKGGSSEVVKDRKYLERKNQQYKSYFKTLNSKIEGADNIVIFGPAQTGEKFVTELQHLNSNLKQKINSVVKADSMTENQMKSWVKDFFK